ncbi:LysE family translocator [Roseibium aggregatum]|uniref:LysE family translocator n=1 Tax=Roseibium aggregatum TaxID=187304 RepID=A0A926NX35_9HYPH|nr:LysE family translocator [Roseibium aggregatum]MBD1546914.1 LysE family translocator [Roseibium aggregatum]
MDAINYPLILGAALIAIPSPGPATLAIAGASMASGRRIGMALGAGVVCGSLTWSTSAAFGLSAIMLAHVWMFEAVRYAGAAYLIYLSIVSARSACFGKGKKASPVEISSMGAAFRKGLAIHLTNPKAILFFGSLYSIGVPAGATAGDLVSIIAAVGSLSAFIMIGYGWLFSIASVRQAYIRLHRWFSGLFALAFGAIGFKLLTTRLV